MSWFLPGFYLFHFILIYKIECQEGKQIDGVEGPASAAVTASQSEKNRNP